MISHNNGNNSKIEQEKADFSLYKKWYISLISYYLINKTLMLEVVNKAETIQKKGTSGFANYNKFDQNELKNAFSMLNQNDYTTYRPQYINRMHSRFELLNLTKQVEKHHLSDQITINSVTFEVETILVCQLFQNYQSKEVERMRNQKVNENEVLALELKNLEELQQLKNSLNSIPELKLCVNYYDLSEFSNFMENALFDAKQLVIASYSDQNDSKLNSSLIDKKSILQNMHMNINFINDMMSRPVFQSEAFKISRESIVQLSETIDNLLSSEKQLSELTNVLDQYFNSVIILSDEVNKLKNTLAFVLNPKTSNEIEAAFNLAQKKPFFSNLSNFFGSIFQFNNKQPKQSNNLQNSGNKINSNNNK